MDRFLYQSSEVGVDSISRLFADYLLLAVARSHP
jgi:hypothetical protein